MKAGSHLRLDSGAVGVPPSHRHVTAVGAGSVLLGPSARIAARALGK